MFTSNLSISGFSVSPVPATSKGLHSIRRIETAANRGAKHPLGPLLWPGSAKSNTVETAQTEVDDYNEDVEDATFHHFAATLKEPENLYLLIKEDSSDKAVAYVWWQYCKGKSEEDWSKTWEDRFRPPEMNKPLADATVGTRFLERAKILGSRDFLMLKELYVLPEYQRQGLGGFLVSLGVSKADEDGLLAYTEASPEGQGLYLRHGFKEKGRVRVDLEPWGGKKGDFDDYGLLLRDKKEV